MTISDHDWSYEINYPWSVLMFAAEPCLSLPYQHYNSNLINIHGLKANKIKQDD